MWAALPDAHPLAMFGLVSKRRGLPAHHRRITVSGLPRARHTTFAAQDFSLSPAFGTCAGQPKAAFACATTRRLLTGTNRDILTSVKC